MSSSIGPKDFWRAESDLLWWHCWQGGELGLKAQSYDFDAPRVEMSSSDDNILAMFAPRRVKAVRAFYRLRPIVAEFAARHPYDAAVIRDAYTPHGWPTLLRTALSLRGNRSSVCLAGLLSLSIVATEERNRALSALSVVDYLAEELSRLDSKARRDRAAKVLARTVEELTALLDAAVARYAAISKEHAAQAKDSGEAWYRALAGAV